jgi:hypothetical protein
MLNTKYKNIIFIEKRFNMGFLMDIIVNSIFDDEWTGRRGEKLSERKLEWLNVFGKDGYILSNIYVPKSNGETSEIDLVYITRKGIFVIESKNYSGWIFGDEKSQNWTVCLAGGKKYRFYNPITQNKVHIKWLNKYLWNNGKKNIPFYSVIVFSERCELKKITVYSENVEVIKRDSLYYTISSIWKSTEDKLSESDISEINKILEKLKEVDASVKQEHIDTIEDKYKNKKSDKSDDSLICPYCGGKLVLRTAKTGKYAGNEFYGCSSYPRCRYIRNIDK